MLRIAPQASRPASFGQERLWFLDQLDPGNPVYNLCFRFALRGRLDVERLERAANAIVARHDVLRTRFVAVDGRPEQIVTPQLTLTVPAIDLGPLGTEERARNVDDFSRHEASRRFDLSALPLLRVVLLRLAPAEHVLVLTVHHVVFDAWSLDVFLAELASAYEGASPLPELPLQYGDYARRQRDWLSSDDARAQLAYWKEQLEGASTLLELPADRARPPVQTFTGAVHRFRFPDETAEGVRRLAREHGATSYMVLLAAFAAVLARYTGREDVVVGTFVAGRREPELERLIGFFSNTLALPVSLAGAPKLGDLVGRVRETVLDALAGQDLPFERLVDELHPERDLARTPIVQVFFAFQERPGAAFRLPGIEVEPLEPVVVGSEFDLGLAVRPDGAALEGMIGYSVDLFEPATVARFADHLLTLLASGLGDPDRPVSALPMLTEDEERELAGWAGTGLAAAPATVHGLIEEQVRRTPEAVALRCSDETLTYRELDRCANRLARHLRARGVGSESLVGVCLDRSVELVVALLAVLKAGGAYVPLDLDYPRRRLELMLADSGAVALVTREDLRERLPEHGPEVVVVDTERPEIERRRGDHLAEPVDPAQLAYVIYTSGSTGTPKGVAVTHANVVGFCAAMAQPLGDGNGVWLAVTSVSFDISVLELLWTLSRGFTVVLHTSDLEAVSTTGVAVWS